jgi:hypothetical protein
MRKEFGIAAKTTSLLDSININENVHPAELYQLFPSHILKHGVPFLFLLLRNKMFS